MLVPPDEATAVFGVATIDGVEPLRPAPLGATVGVWRVHAARSSAVLKLLRPDASPNVNWAASEDPAHPRWWRRELATLRDGLPDLLQPALRPARLLQANDRSDGSLALWLEDLGPPPTWTVDGLIDVARLLGAAQARLARRLPPGLAHGFLRAYLEPRLPHLAEPFAGRRDELLARLDAAPQTMCHFDLHPANVFALASETAVVDWAYCGRGPVGADAGVLASDALADEVVSADDADALVREVWLGYREGLADDALAAAAADVYAIGTALRYAWLPAWLAGEYGPPVGEQRARGVSAAHAAFAALAADRL